MSQKYMEKWQHWAIFYATTIVNSTRENISSVYILKVVLDKCFLTEDTGTDFIEEIFGEGEIIGGIEIINNQTTLCTIEAITELTVFVIKREDFNILLVANSTFNKMILKALSFKIHYKALRFSYNQSQPVESNLLRLKKDLPELISAIPKQDIAIYLGITLRSLNRVLRELEGK